MLSTLYTDADLQRWDATAPSGGPSDRREEHRTPFQVDRDRIVFSYAFRRLQSKTQVFQSGDYDFYRTRLTHSIEVAKIGRSITENLNRQRIELNPDAGIIDLDLVEAACLAHDLGHPPFGHIGERTLNECMGPYGGFEGNAQTLRILTHLIFDRPEGSAGMQPTRAFLDSVLKYKTLFSEKITETATAPGRITYPRHHFIYDAQRPILEFVQKGLPNTVKSIECQIMDWADDTAYSLNDLSDGIQAGYLTPMRIRQWMVAAHSESPHSLDEQDTLTLDRLIQSIESGTYERTHAGKIGRFIQGACLHADTASSPYRHLLSLEIDAARLKECRLYKRLAFDLIFQSPQIQQNEFRGRTLLLKLFDALMECYSGPVMGLKILPQRWHNRVMASSHTSPEDRPRLLCDALSAMTDNEAIRLYQRLFNADYGSLSDIM